MPGRCARRDGRSTRAARNGLTQCDFHHFPNFNFAPMASKSKKRPPTTSSDGDDVDTAVRESPRRRGSLSSIKDDPNEMNPRRWEALVERACGGHDDDMLHEMALAEQAGRATPSPDRNAPTRRRKHPDVLKELWAMALHPTSVSLVQRGCLALLSLCSEPGVNAHVRDSASVSERFRTSIS